MTLTSEQILQLAQGSDPFTADLVLLVDSIVDRIKQLEARIQQLEMREATVTAKTLKLVQNDGHS
jgi:hypothetical protein